MAVLPHGRTGAVELGDGLVHGHDPGKDREHFVHEEVDDAYNDKDWL